ncbi:PQQ-binding-like beta-propeller repeat protein [bacterium]|nr:PQQ-binding-like beta-propeller repeat protein [bacterium]
MNFKVGLSLALLSSLILTSCTMLQKINEDSNRAFVVNAFWVQDTLAKKNHEFRKINRMSPVIYKNSIIAGNAYDGLVSYGMDSKNKNWRVDIPFGVEASGAAIKDRLFVGSNNGTMYSIDLANGQIVWQFDTKSELVGEPLLNEGILYFVSGSQSLYALDASNGKQLWIHNRQDTASNMTIRGGSKPSISNGLVYAGFSDGTLVAINAKTGTEQWEITLNRNTKFRDIDASPVIDGDFIYINSYDDKIYCVSKDKGEIVWTQNFGGASTPLIFQDKIFVVSSKGEIVALSKKEGTEIWKHSTSQGVYTEPGLINNIIVAGESQGKLQFFEPTTGKKLGSFEPGRGVFSKPSIYGDELYFVSGEGNVYGITARYENKSRIYYLK